MHKHVVEVKLINGNRAWLNEKGLKIRSHKETTLKLGCMFFSLPVSVNNYQHISIISLLICWVRLAQSLVFCVHFKDNYVGLSFFFWLLWCLPFIYGFWLPFGIFKPFIQELPQEIHSFMSFFTCCFSRTRDFPRTRIRVCIYIRAYVADKR